MVALQHIVFVLPIEDSLEPAPAGELGECQGSCFVSRNVTSANSEKYAVKDIIHWIAFRSSVIYLYNVFRRRRESEEGTISEVFVGTVALQQMPVKNGWNQWLRRRARHGRI